jgi:DNA-binding transcriptional MerR regulator
VPDRAGRSIGEVLEELRDDFPDVSVSKIRFLESQGLINPKRTASGYRQFSDQDLALLRWILNQQREHYLPLKVIRRRLRDGDGPGRGPAEETGPEKAPAPLLEPARSLEPAPATEPVLEAKKEAAWLVPEGQAPLALATTPAEVSGPGPVPAAAFEPTASTPRAARPSEEDLWPRGPGRTYTRAELAAEVGLDERTLSELESFGLLPRGGGEYDDDARRVAEIAAAFSGFGVEARHLRMYKSFAEREAAFLEQVVMPMVNPRHEESRARSREALADLARLGQALRLSMLRAALGPPPG